MDITFAAAAAYLWRGLNDDDDDEMPAVEHAEEEEEVVLEAEEEEEEDDVAADVDDDCGCCCVTPAGLANVFDISRLLVLAVGDLPREIVCR